MKKKLFALTMCLLMVMCFMPTAAFANPPAEGQATDAGVTNLGSTPANATGKTIYVDANSSAGAPDGTEESPYKTIQAAINAASNGDTVLVKAGNYNVWCPGENTDNKRTTNDSKTPLGHNIFIGKDITIKGEGEVNIYSLQDTYPGYTESFIVVLISGSHGVVLENLNIYPAYYKTQLSESFAMTNSKINTITDNGTLYVYQVQTIYTIRSLNRGLTESHTDIQNVTIRNCTIGEKEFPNNTSNSVIWLSAEINSAIGLTGGYVIENNTVYGGITICENAGRNAEMWGQDCIIQNNILHDRIMLDGYRPTTKYNYQSMTVFPTITGNTFNEVNWTQKTDLANYDYCVYSRDKNPSMVLAEAELKEIIDNNTFAGDLAEKSIGIAIGTHKKDGADEAHALIYAFTPVTSITSGDTTTQYSTIAEAIAAASNGQTIKLLGDISKEFTVAEGKNVKIDLNGKTISGNVTNNGTLTIADSSGTGKVTSTLTNGENCTLTVTGGTFSADPTSYAASGYKVTKNANETYTVSRRTSSGGGGGGGSSSSSSSSGSAVVNTTETKTDTSASGTQTTTVPETKATVSAETKTAADGTKTTTATVTEAVATQIVEKAVENKSEEVVVSAAAMPVAETAAGTTTEVAIPAETVSQIAEKTTAAVTIESEAAKVTLDQEAVAAVAEAAGETGTVSLVVETKAQDENKVEVDLKIETSNGTVSDFKGGTVSVTVKLNSALASKPVICVYIDDNGVYHKVQGQKNADGTYTFQTGHFSTYAIMAVEDANAVIAQQDSKAAELTKALKLKASSTKTKKGSIKVTLKVDADEIKDIEDLGYTVKYKFYRSTKKSSSYKAKIEGKGKTYTNTTGKTGTRYYYKARVMVYDTEGTLIAKTALKQCKYATRVR